MKETLDLIRAWRELPAGAEILLATVVETSGSTYRKAGARMLLTRKGWEAGSISGGCLESDIVKTAWEKTANGPILTTYDATAEDDIVWGFGLGCNGTVRVLLDRLPANGGTLRILADLVEKRIPAVLATVVEGPSLGAVAAYVSEFEVLKGSIADVQGLDAEMAAMLGTEQRRVVRFGPESIYIESLMPPRPLLIFGGGQDAIPLATAAKSLGWQVTVVDWRESNANLDKFPMVDALVVNPAADILNGLSIDERSATVVMSHHYLNDQAILKQLLPTRTPYVGLLGPRRRADRMLAEIRRDEPEIVDEMLVKVHSPVGLDIGAEGPEEIALAIMAEMCAFFRERTGGFLSAVPDSIHATA